MAKRFTDTEKWKDDWYLSLNNDYRQIWLWLLDNCNHAGLCKRSLTLLNIMNNTQITEDDLLEVFQNRIMIYQDYWFIPKFIFFQYGNDFLTSNSKAVVSAIKSMIQYGIITETEDGILTFSIELPNPYHTLTKPYSKSIHTLKDKDKDKDKELDKEKEKDKGEDETSFNLFQSYFPNGKNSVTHNEIAIWNSLGTQERQICLQLTPMYIQHHLKGGKGSYIKNIKNFLNDGFWNQLYQFQSRYLGKKVELKNTLTGSDKKHNLTIDENLSMIENL
jgi:hypothetical protein